MLKFENLVVCYGYGGSSICFDGDIVQFQESLIFCSSWFNYFIVVVGGQMF